MHPHVIESRYIGACTIWLKFSDGAQGEIDLKNELHGPVFEPLKDVAMFRTFYVNPELGTIAWPSGADFAPEFLRAELKVAA
jgi:hypothetical protein